MSPFVVKYSGVPVGDSDWLRSEVFKESDIQLVLLDSPTSTIGPHIMPPVL